MFLKPLKCHLPTYKHTCTHGRGQKFSATISNISNLSTHKHKNTHASHLRRKPTVKRSRHLSGFFTRGGALEGRDERSRLKSSPLARGGQMATLFTCYISSHCSKCGCGSAPLGNNTPGCGVTSVCVDFLWHDKLRVLEVGRKCLHHQVCSYGTMTPYGTHRCWKGKDAKAIFLWFNQDL